MQAHYRLCQSDEDYAQFTLFFIRHRKDFSHQFSLADALMHTLLTIDISRILLILDEMNQTIGWMHYRYVAADYEPHPTGEIAFVDSVIMTEEYRSSRLFVRGFRHLVHHIAIENPLVSKFQFYTLQDHSYLNRLYAKFASIIGQREGYHGIENIFSANFPILLQYLNNSDR